MSARYEIQKSEKLGRYLVAAKNLKAGERIFCDEAFVIGPNSDTSLVCYNCYLPLINKFLICKNCAVAPICPGDGCPDESAGTEVYWTRRHCVVSQTLPSGVGFYEFTLSQNWSYPFAPHVPAWHDRVECDFFRNLKLGKGLSPMTMVQNVGSLLVLRALLKKDTNPQAWEEFMQLETHLEERRESSVWQYYSDGRLLFINSLGLLEGVENSNIVQKVCAAIDVNSFEVRGPPIPAIGCAEMLRGVYLKAALLAHDCISNTHMAINDSNLLVCHASTDIKKGDVIYYNYTDPLKGTLLRQQHLLVGKYFKCSCDRCSDPTEMGTYMSSAICADCKTGYITSNDKVWTCHNCKKEFEKSNIDFKVKCCSDKLEVINKKDEKELEEYIKYVSLVLAPHHYLLLDAKQRLAGVLRDTINREPRPTKKMMRRKIELCQDLLPVLEKISPGICRTKAITLFELHITIVQLAKKLFDAREITAAVYMDELLSAEKHLKRALEMLLIEPGNSPEGELCAKALELYRSLKNTMSKVLDGIHADGKTYDSAIEKELEQSLHLTDVD